MDDVVAMFRKGKKIVWWDQESRQKHVGTIKSIQIGCGDGGGSWILLLEPERKLEKKNEDDREPEYRLEIEM